MKKIEQLALAFIDQNRLLAAGEKILVAFSGGADSVFLLTLLNKFKQRYKIELGAVHINHKLRKITADEDEQFCRDMCASLEIPFFAVSKDVKKYAVDKKLSIEEAARIVRYSIFETIAASYSYNKIATAHNVGDNTETVLLNLIKGTGLSGVAGIPIERGNIIRPILSTSKEDILKYLLEERIAFRFDESNKENIYERNFLRNEVIPLLKTRFGSAIEGNIFRSSNIFRNYINTLSTETDLLVRRACSFQNGILKIDFIKIENPFFFNDVIKKALFEFFEYKCCYEDIRKIIGIWNKKNGKKSELKESLIAYKESEKIIICRKSGESEYLEKTITVGQKICINDKEELYISLIDKKNIAFSGNRKTEYISADNLDSEFVVRKWKAGDKFRPLGLKGIKKISDFLNDQKIPIRTKENQLLLTQDDKIIWVLGLRIDDRFKLSDNTKKVLKLCLK